MVYLSVLSFIASAIYFFTGYNVFKSNRRSELYRSFFYLTCSLTIWAYAFGFVYLAADKYFYSFWNKLSAFGWCTFEALGLYFVLILTGNKAVRHWYVKLIVMLPAFAFLFMVVFLFGPDISTSRIVSNIFYTGNFIYNFTYLLVSIIMIFLWGHRSESRLKKKQADIISICSLISFLLNLVIQDVLPLLHIAQIPFIGQLLSLIMILGVNNAITKYQFMSIPSSLITDELFNELTGLTFLTDSQGFIMKVNKQVSKLLDYKEEEIIGSPITDLIKDQKFDAFMGKWEEIVQKMKFYEIDVLHKSGIPIPFHITVIPLSANSKLLRGLLVIGEDIRPTKQLKYEIEAHKLSNEKLKYGETLLRRTLEITPVAMILIDKDTGRIKYQNSQAENLFGIHEGDWIGKSVSSIIINQEDQYYLREYYDHNRNINSYELPLQRSDGISFTGMVTVLPSIVGEERIALVCVVDMTKQKQAEDMLKQKNEAIIKLNEELLQMNNSLIDKSVRDGLTNLYNHQYMNEVLNEKLTEARENRTPLCLMMMDIDHFKRVNDRFGHIIGDKVLAAVSQLIRENTGTNDIIGRYGGEEFIIILSGTELKEASEIAERIRLSICGNDYGVENLTVSISIGVTIYEGETLNALINKADMLLYLAKANGRNRVESILN